MFQNILNQHYADVKRLLRRYKIIGDVSPATIEKAFNRKGEKFMMELLEIITPDDSSYTNLLTNTAVLNGQIANQMISEQQLEKAVNEGGKFWSFWNNLLSGIANTGQAIGQFKTNVSGANTITAQDELYYRASQANNNRLIFAGAGFLVVVIILLLIFRK